MISLPNIFFFNEIIILKFLDIRIHYMLVLLACTGGIPLPVFSEWWLAREKFSKIDSFIQSSFPGAMFQGSNGLSIKYQVLPIGQTPVFSSVLDYFLLLYLVLFQFARRKKENSELCGA